MQIPMAVTAGGNIPSEDNGKTPQSCNSVELLREGAPWTAIAFYMAVLEPWKMK